MPRRRMIDPDFWNDGRVKRLSPTERLLFVGMISYADDEGRLLADPAFLRSKIFPYDDFALEDIISMRDHILKTNPNLQLYQNAGEDYLYFRKWPRYQKPSHPQPSKLPKPPKLQEAVPEEIIEPVIAPSQPETGTIPPQVSLGQSSLGQDSIGKVSAVQEDFKEFFNSESDLTDFLLKTMTKYISAGREQVLGGLGGGGPGELTQEKEPLIKAQWGIVVLEKFWSQAVGKLGHELWEGAYQALKKYPLAVVAKAFVKASRYQGGKYQKWKYIQTIIDEEMQKEK